MNVEYWWIRGRGHPIRCMAFYLSLDFTETRLSMEDAPGYFQKKGEGAAGENPLINLPSITDGDVFVSELRACIVYLLEKAGKLDMSDNTWQREQMSSIVREINRGCTDLCYEAADKYALIDALNQKYEGWSKYQMAGVAKQLGSKPFLFGEKPVTADFALADLLEKLAAMDNELETATKMVKGNATWEDYLARFYDLPKIKEFRASEKFVERPFISPLAKWF